jgi:opacity protein-like surface antigen
MRKIALGLALGMLLGAATAAAQAGAGSAPQLEVAAGYAYLRVRTAVPTGFNMHGGSISAAANVNSWLGFVGEVAYDSTKNVPPSGFTLNVTSYMFGPRVSYRGHDRITLFAHNLVGVGHAGGTLYTAGFQQGTAPPAAQNAFAMAVGAGLDVNLSRRWAIRAFQTDWLFTTFPNGAGNYQHSFRLTTGIVWRIGSR